MRDNRLSKSPLHTLLVGERESEGSPQVQGHRRIYRVRRPTSPAAACLVSLVSLACSPPSLSRGRIGVCRQLRTAYATAQGRGRQREFRGREDGREGYEHSGSPRRRMTWVLRISAGELRFRGKFRTGDWNMRICGQR